MKKKINWYKWMTIIINLFLGMAFVIIGAKYLGTLDKGILGLRGYLFQVCLIALVMLKGVDWMFSWTSEEQKK